MIVTVAPRQRVIFSRRDLSRGLHLYFLPGFPPLSSQLPPGPTHSYLPPSPLPAYELVCAAAPWLMDLLDWTLLPGGCILKSFARGSSAGPVAPPWVNTVLPTPLPLSWFLMTFLGGRHNWSRGHSIGGVHLQFFQVLPLRCCSHPLG